MALTTARGTSAMTVRGQVTILNRLSTIMFAALLGGVALILFVALYQSPRLLRVDLGGHDGGLVSDFFDSERSPSYTFRWTKAESAIILPALAGGPQRLSIGIAAPRPPGQPAPQVEILLDDTTLTRMTLGPEYRRLTFDVSLPVTGAGTHTLRVRSPTFVENAVRGRSLGVIVDDVTVQPRQRPLIPPLAPLVAFALDAVLLAALLARVRTLSRTAAFVATVAVLLCGVAYQVAERQAIGPIAAQLAIPLLFACGTLILAERIARRGLAQPMTLTALTLLVGASLAAMAFLLSLQRISAPDFRIFDDAAGAILHHRPQDLYDLDKIEQDRTYGVFLIYKQPPAAAALLVPLAALNYGLAQLLWQALLVGCATLGIGVLGRELGLEHEGEPAGWPAFALITLALVWEPLWESVRLGQWNPILLVLLVMTLIGLRRNRPLLTGVGIGLAGVLKLYPFYLIILLLFRRDWRALLWTAISALALTLVGIVAAGWDATWFFARHVLPAVGGGTSDVENQALAGLLTRLFGDAPDRVTTGIGFLVPTGLLCWALARSPNDDTEGATIAYALAIAAMLLSLPVAWVHYEAILLIPVAVLVLLLARRTLTAPWLALAAGSVVLLLFGSKSGVLNALLYPSRDIGRTILVSTRVFAQIGFAAVLWYSSHYRTELNREASDAEIGRHDEEGA